MIHILHVDDEPHWHDELKKRFEKRTDVTIYSGHNESAALNSLEKAGFAIGDISLLVTDGYLGTHSTANDVLQAFDWMCYTGPVVLLSSEPEKEEWLALKELYHETTFSDFRIFGKRDGGFDKVRSYVRKFLMDKA